jgi:hypothetical protein
VGAWGDRVPDFITQTTMNKALDDRDDGKSYDVADGRVAGLELRVRPRSVRWSMRTALHGKRTRFDLGPAVAGEADVGGLSIKGARSRAARVAEMARNGHNPETFLAALASGVSMETQLKVEAARPKPSWTWEAAKTAFLADVKRTRREDTHRDYKGKLQSAELSRFHGRLVNTITRNEMAVAIAEVHGRRKEAMAAGMVRVVKRMWTWLAEAPRQDDTNVPDGVMVKLAAPEKTRVEVGEPVKPKSEQKKPEKNAGRTPPPIEIGRVLAIARLGCLPERIGLGIQLLVGTVQRRRTVTGTNSADFQQVDDEVIWRVPPYFRKSGTKRGNRSHLVPCIGFAATVQERLERLADVDDTNWIFPAGKTNRSDRPHAEAGLFNDYLEAMPGVSWSPHGARYAFATYGEGQLGFAQGEASLILDHLEGTEPDNVTSQFYSSDPQIGRKRAMMRAWVDWCEAQMAEALKTDKALLDRELMAREIKERRYKKAPA